MIQKRCSRKEAKADKPNEEQSTPGRPRPHESALHSSKLPPSLWTSFYSPESSDKVTHIMIAVSFLSAQTISVNHEPCKGLVHSPLSLLTVPAKNTYKYLNPTARCPLFTGLDRTEPRLAKRAANILSPALAGIALTNPVANGRFRALRLH